MKKTLAIETSCDDTSLAIVSYDQWRFSVDSIIAYSQIEHHQPFGGVVPEIAFRLHSEQILALVKHFPADTIAAVDHISVTTHPWLGWSLLVGKTVAHMLGEHYNKEVIHVHHIYGHIFSLLLERDVKDLPFPWVVLTVSGGHNELYHIDKETGLSRDITDWMSNELHGESLIEPVLMLSDLTITKLWHTLDDAAGECFDKVARMVGGPYPGGQWISEQALKGKPHPDYRFKRILLGDHTWSYDFSFSGMKAQAYTLLRRICAEHGLSEWVESALQLEPQIIADICYEFQEAVCDTLAMKLAAAVKEFSPATVGIVGGVSANDRLYELAQSMLVGENVLRPTKKLYSTDNGAMIGVVGLLS